MTNNTLHPKQGSNAAGEDLETACREGNREQALACRSAGAPIGDALHAAIEGGHPTIVDDLLTSGVSANGRRRIDGSTPIQTLARHGSLENSRQIIYLLLEHGASLESSGPWTALHIASILGRYHSVISLLAAGANPGTPSGLKKETAAHAAAVKGNINILTALIGSSPYVVHSTDRNGKTPLHYSARANQAEATMVLIESGADIDDVDMHSNTPLLSASYGVSVASATALIEKGADVNARTIRGDTALLIVARSAGLVGAQVLQMVDLLLRAGGDVTLLNIKGESPMDVVGLLSTNQPERGDIAGVKQMLEQARLDQVWDRRSGAVVVKKLCDSKPGARTLVALGRGGVGWENAVAWLVLESPTVILQRVVKFL